MRRWRMVLSLLVAIPLVGCFPEAVLQLPVVAEVWLGAGHVPNKGPVGGMRRMPDSLPWLLL